LVYIFCNQIEQKQSVREKYIYFNKKTSKIGKSLINKNMTAKRLAIHLYTIWKLWPQSLPPHRSESQ